jgi:MFS family permease
MLWAIPLIALGLTGAAPAALVAFAVIGIANTVVDVAALTLLQRAVPDEVLARVFGALEGLLVATVGIGGAVAPLMVGLVGAKGAAIIFGVFLLVVTALAWTRLRAVDAEAEPPYGLELLRGVPIFARLPEPVLEHLAGAAEEVTAENGAAIVSQGEAGDHFYIIADGEAAVYAPGETIVLGPGGFFGEIALLRDVPRTATVRAVGPARLLAIQRDDFVAAVTGHAPSAEAADAVVAQRLSESRTRR